MIARSPDMGWVNRGWNPGDDLRSSVRNAGENSFGVKLGRRSEDCARGCLPGEAMPEKEFGVAVVAPMHGDDHEDGDPYRHPGQEEIRVGIKI